MSNYSFCFALILFMILVGKLEMALVCGNSQEMDMDMVMVL